MNERLNHITHTPYGSEMTMTPPANLTSNPNWQPYRFSGNELDNTYGLDWYDIQARQYDPVVPSWHRMDPLCEKHYDVSPYCYCGGNPIGFVDSDGMDYWSTSDPNEIDKFMQSIKEGNYNYDMSGWEHTSDDDFLANLHYNDIQNTYYYNYGTVENGEVVCVSQSYFGRHIWTSDRG